MLSEADAVWLVRFWDGSFCDGLFRMVCFEVNGLKVCILNVLCVLYFTCFIFWLSYALIISHLPINRFNGEVLFSPSELPESVRWSPLRRTSPHSFFCVRHPVHS